jgi:hypothetical protein
MKDSARVTLWRECQANCNYTNPAHGHHLFATKETEPTPKSSIGELPTKPFPLLDDKVLKHAMAIFPSVTGLGRICAMQNAQDAGSAEIWSAAQNRRIEDLAGLATSLRAKNDWRPIMPRLALMRRLTAAMIASALLASVSATVQGKKHPQVALRPTAAMPAVNVP